DLLRVAGPVRLVGSVPVERAHGGRAEAVGVVPGRGEPSGGDLGGGVYRRERVGHGDAHVGGAVAAAPLQYAEGAFDVDVEGGLRHVEQLRRAEDSGEVDDDVRVGEGVQVAEDVVADLA